MVVINLDNLNAKVMELVVLALLMPIALQQFLTAVLMEAATIAETPENSVEIKTVVKYLINKTVTPEMVFALIFVLPTTTANFWSALLIVTSIRVVA